MARGWLGRVLGLRRGRRPDRRVPRCSYWLDTAALLVAAPFVFGEPRKSQLATAVIALRVVIAIGAMLPGVARRAVRPVPYRRTG
ncbi:MAG: hypothetical protein QOF53_2872 [Nocardioidaceae bacterium]|nr:hypothetical protein [Nocardioidaceae bacterium]